MVPNMIEQELADILAEIGGLMVALKDKLGLKTQLNVTDEAIWLAGMRDGEENSPIVISVKPEDEMCDPDPLMLPDVEDEQVVVVIFEKAIQLIERIAGYGNHVVMDLLSSSPSDPNPLVKIGGMEFEIAA